MPVVYNNMFGSITGSRGWVLPWSCSTDSAVVLPIVTSPFVGTTRRGPDRFLHLSDGIHGVVEDTYPVLTTNQGSSD